MLTADQINAATAAANRRSWITLAACSAASLAYMVTWAAIRARHGPALREAATRHVGPVAVEILAGLTVCPVAFLMPGALLSCARRERLRPDPRLTCPACGGSIGGAAWAIATRQCSRCGKMILADPMAGDDPADPRGRDERLISIDDFRAANGALLLHTLLVPVGLFIYMGAVAGVQYLGGPALADFAARHLGETARNILGVALALSFFAYMIGGLSLVAYRWRRDPRVTCRWCGGSLADHQHVVLETRNCSRCGRAALTKRASDFA